MSQSVSAAPNLDLTLQPAALTQVLVDIPSVSGTEGPLADAIEAALRRAAHLEVVRIGNSVMARSNLGREQRVLLAGHIDTVPIADNVPSRLDGDILHGCGTTDMKSGDAVLLTLAGTLQPSEMTKDLTFIFYECEEIEHERNGLTRIERELPEWLTADLAILGEPTNGAVEAGCQGTAALQIAFAGKRSHSARSWMGVNAIHAAGEVLARLANYQGRDVDIDGCLYREGLNAVDIAGGVAGNVIPDECVIRINFRFAPDRDAANVTRYLEEFFAGFDVEILEMAMGAKPGLAAAAAAEFVAAAGGVAVAKFGWTDVSRFSALGIPAINYGPGDPSLAHTREERVSLQQIGEMAAVLRAYLTS
ncbi:succinyl-diaminopimelate desuccinylase [Nakamurella antarctica]|uniref:Succinyl-diaminopimelate desuccinylase n=1 Tax=Nakamurella antarctica TaxID=1902245 RepID=A0A3G8ZJU4_9ACTN|nr:succinyl-diaminopimelate desuccinylase [Nakamurella antarctica]AZI57458.1 succinyl-diaminopimelate desuccinylase [Nakamurella antarctica]